MKHKLKKSILITILASSVGLSQAQQITHWTEQNGTLGLGYPAPIPVDTPEPFDGFRTYEGLHNKHMQITNDNPHISAHVIGQTIDNRDIWAYRLSDENQLTKYGVPEGGMLINGGIHAREWQSPETVTGIMELIHDNRNDESLHQFLLENTQIVVIPVNNVDGFLQTQRFPTSNIYSNQEGPRDGRMRRKNMRNVDEVLSTQSDYLFGIDLNRNNDPYWAFTENSNNPRSSGDPTSIVHRGIAAFSEPESIARRDSVNLLDPDHLRIYTDVHSFSLVHFSTLTFNQNRNALQGRLLADFTNYHMNLPGNKVYVNVPSAPGGGIGATDEYFGYTYEVPSWTLEIEPSNGGVDYGGFGNNGHDGFILPESEIRRVRENLAKTFVATWYGQAGPPSIVQMRLVDPETDAVVYDAEWDTMNDDSRELFKNQIEHIMPGKTYQMLLRFDKPMRIRNEEGEASSLAGINLRIDPVIQAQLNGQSVSISVDNGEWINQKNHSWKSFGFYKDDTFVTELTIDENLSFDNGDELTWRIVGTDLLNQVNDGDPATVVTWSNGQWQNYESTDGVAGINGGFDSTLTSFLGSEPIHDAPPMVAATGLYYNANRAGEGISMEVLSDNRFWLTWYTFDDMNQDWFTSSNSYSGNILNSSLLSVTGGIFGPDFNPEDTTVSQQGSLEMVFSAGTELEEPIGFQHLTRSAAVKYTYPDGRKFRTEWTPLGVTAGFSSDLSNALPIGDPIPPVALAPAYTGSWYNSDRAGEGYHIEILHDNRAALLWYAFSPDGEKKWFVDMQGEITATTTGINLKFNQIAEAKGTAFGEEFNANDVIISLWGSAEFNLTCTDGTVNFQSNDSTYGSGSYEIEPLTRPVGNAFPCN